ncbi:MAG TPA: hypothetical protein VFS43_16725 [Polyangiaceae bacterium]|nr:hypothetical protein [Polyangiaceae bacterium]
MRAQSAAPATAPAAQPAAPPAQPAAPAAPPADSPAQPAAASGPAPAAPEPAPAEQNLGRTANNAVFVELLGNGGVYSVNYERFIDNFGIRAGFSYLSIGAASDTSSAKVSFVTFPVVASYYLGSANHKLQLGAGATVVYLSGESETELASASASGLGVGATGVVGYRYMPRTGGFNFGVGFTPIIGAGGFLPWGGISFGAVF